MDILGFGSSELVVIALLAALVLGPRRMAQSAREIGKLMRNLRNYVKELTGDLSKELDLLAEPQAGGKDSVKR